MRRFTSVLLAAFLLLSVFAFPQAVRKKRVAVMSFDYGTVHSNVAAIFGSDQDVGKGISDLLIQKLVNDGKYSVIERAQLDKIMAEQNFSNSDRADANSAAKIGRILGVDAIITGSITQFGRDDQHTNVGGGGYGGITGRYGLGGVGTHSAKAVVGVTARIIDVSTAEILAACTGQGTSKRSGVSLLGAGGSVWNGGGGSLDMGSSNFGETILGEAVHQAVDSLGAQLDAKADAMPTHKVSVSGVIADVSGNTIIVNIGSRAGLKVGDILEINHPVRTVKDPTTGKVLKTVSDRLGTATVSEVDEDSATLNFAGSGSPKVGDTVKTAE